MLPSAGWCVTTFPDDEDRASGRLWSTDVMRIAPGSPFYVPHRSEAILAMDVEPEAPRFVVENLTRGAKVTIPARCSWFAVIFLSVWLVGWVLGEITAVKQLLAPSEKTPVVFLLVWLAAWTFGGATAVATMAWQVAGKEILTFDAASLERRLEAFGIGRSRRYRMAEIRNLRRNASVLGSLMPQWRLVSPMLGYGAGSVAFDYGARTVQVAAALEQVEAKLLIDALSPHLPRDVLER